MYMNIYIYFIYTHFCLYTYTTPAVLSVEVQPSFTQYCVTILPYIAILHNISRYIAIFSEFRETSRYTDTSGLANYISPKNPRCLEGAIDELQNGEGRLIK